jgi:diketogulonate reductase-like aldo/keto reductase
LVRWSIQKGAVTIPKSTKPGRVKENFDVWGFELSDSDMQRLDALHTGLKMSWNPTGIP